MERAGVGGGKVYRVFILACVVEIMPVRKVLIRDDYKSLSNTRYLTFCLKIGGMLDFKPHLFI